MYKLIRHITKKNTLFQRRIPLDQLFVYSVYKTMKFSISWYSEMFAFASKQYKVCLTKLSHR